MKKTTLILTCILIFSLFNIYAQDNDVVRVKVVSKAATEAEAITEGLRSALTQASSVFISSNTTIIDDEISSDNISMINNGSVHNYNVINKITGNDGSISMTLEVFVSVDKLGSFIKSKAGDTKLQGGLFAANIKLQELNEKSELKAVQDLIEISEELLNISFDYKIKAGDPKNDDGKWAIPLNIEIYKNKNYNNFTNFLYSTLKSISMTPADIESYKKLNKELFSVGLFDNSELPYSTPLIYFSSSYDHARKKLLKSLPNNIEFNFYKESDTDELPFVLLTNNLKQAIKIERKYDKYKNFYDKLYTTHNNGKIDLIVLRSEKSYQALISFFESIEKNIKNISISNGIDEFNLIDHDTGIYTSNSNISNDLSSNHSNFFIGLNNSGYSGDFFYGVKSKGSNCNYCKEGNYRERGFDHFAFGKTHYKYSFPYPRSFNILRNYTWDERIFYQDGHVNFLSLKSAIEYGQLNDQEKSDYINIGKHYFYYLFGNYVEYLNKLAKKDLKIRDGKRRFDTTYSFPVQLTLIGDDNNCIFKIGLIQRLSTDKISKVSKYSISKN